MTFDIFDMFDFDIFDFDTFGSHPLAARVPGKSAQRGAVRRGTGKMPIVSLPY
jgi:hypothetical protein